MFDIAWSEVLLVAILALVFIGPKELPHVLHTLGRASARLRRSADDFRRQFEESMREAGYEDLQKNLHDFRSLNPANQLRDTIDRAIKSEFSAEKPNIDSTAEVVDESALAAYKAPEFPAGIPAETASPEPAAPPAAAASPAIFQTDTSSLEALRQPHGEQPVANGAHRNDLNSVNDKPHSALQDSASKNNPATAA